MLRGNVHLPMRSLAAWKRCKQMRTSCGKQWSLQQHAGPSQPQSRAPSARSQSQEEAEQLLQTASSALCTCRMISIVLWSI